MVEDAGDTDAVVVTDHARQVDIDAGDRGQAGDDAQPGEAVEAAQVTRPRVRGRRASSRIKRLPVLLAAAPVGLVFALVALFALAGISGTSVGALNDAPGAWKKDPYLVTGRPWAVRSDEYALWTPNIAANARRGLPAVREQGLTRVFLPASSVGAPSRHWTEIFKPYDWPLLAGVPLQKAFAARWWLLLGFGLVGAYSLFLVLTRSPVVASGLALAAVLTPASAWWTNQPAPIIGGMAGCSALLLLAFRAARTRTAVLLGMAAGYCAVVATLVMYPPWTLTVAIPCGALLLGLAVDDRVPWRRVVLSAGGALAVAVPAMAAWYVQGRDAIEATRNTIYPGHRVSHGAGANAAWLFDAPISYLFTHGKGNFIQGSWAARSGEPLVTNLSELSSTWMPVPLVLVVVLLALLARRAARAIPVVDAVTAAPAAGEPGPVATPAPRPGVRATVPWWTACGLAAVCVLYLSWALLPLPDVLGSVTMLSQVPGRRMIVGLGWVCVLAVAVGYRCVPAARPSSRWVPVLAGAGALSWAGMMLASVTSFQMRSFVGTQAWLVLVAATVVVAFGLAAPLVDPRLRWGALAAGLVAALVYAPVNPLYRGLGPLDHDPLVKALRPLVHDGVSPRTVVFGGQTTNALVTASGVTNLSGVTPYPDRAFWQRWAPGQEELWNKYANNWWAADPSLGGDGVVLEPLRGTVTRLRANPCSPFMRALRVEVVVSETPLTATCLTDEQFVERRTSLVSAYVYRVTPEAG